MFEPLPVKLLDCPTVALDWPPQGFVETGRAVRLDYTTDLHQGGLWTPYFHNFTSDVRLHEPGDSHEDQSSVPPAIDPIWMGFVDRVYLQVGEVLVAAAGANDTLAGGPDPHEVVTLPALSLFWDHENTQLLLVPDDSNEPWVVLRGPELFLDQRAMIGG